MKNAFRILFCLLITIGSYSALAQTRITISQALDGWISNCEKDVVSAADAMPEAKYSYVPTAGEFTGARTFAEQIKHLAANKYRMARACSDRRPRLIRRPRPDPKLSDQSLKSLTTSRARSLRCTDPPRP
jgi:hypothetical protein